MTGQLTFRVRDIAGPNDGLQGSALEQDGRRTSELLAPSAGTSNIQDGTSEENPLSARPSLRHRGCTAQRKHHTQHRYTHLGSFAGYPAPPLPSMSKTCVSTAQMGLCRPMRRDGSHAAAGRWVLGRTLRIGREVDHAVVDQTTRGHSGPAGVGAAPASSKPRYLPASPHASMVSIRVGAAQGRSARCRPGTSH